MKLADVEPRDLMDFSKLPPAGVWLPALVTDGEATTSSNNNSMIKLQLQLNAEGFEGYTLFENGIVTDASAKGAGFAVKKLQGLGVDTSKEKEDQEIVDELKGKEIFVKVRHELMKDKDGNGKFTIPRLDDDGKPVKKAVPQEYSLYDPGAQKEQKTVAPPKKEEPAKEQETAGVPTKSDKPVPPWMNKNAKK